MEAYKKWIAATLILILLPLAAIAGFNLYIDPLWNFNHAHPYNRIQMSFNERQQKTNLLTFGRHDYNALMLGSSRVTYISQYDFPQFRVFNYALSKMLLGEYGAYLDYAKQQVGHDFDCVIIGLDFFATNKNLELLSSFEEPAYYFGQSRQPGYRFKMLLSSDVLKYACKNYEASREGLPRSYAYDRANVKTLVPPAPEDRQWLINNNLKRYGEKVYGAPDYRYDSVKSVLRELKKANPHTRFIIFTTPVSDLLFQLLVSKGRFDDYERWIRDCVEANGEVYNFMYPNSITVDLDNYYDANHFYPRIGTLIAHRISGYKDKNLPQDFGVRVTPENLERHLRYVARQAGL